MPFFMLSRCYCGWTDRVNIFSINSTPAGLGGERSSFYSGCPGFSESNVTTWSQDYIHITRRPKKNVKGAKSAVFLEKTAVKAIPEVILKNT